jgi:hypothetical protein
VRRLKGQKAPKAGAGTGGRSGARAGGRQCKKRSKVAVSAAELKRLVERWDELPRAVRRAIQAMVDDEGDE